MKISILCFAVALLLLSSARAFSSPAEFDNAYALLERLKGDSAAAKDPLAKARIQTELDTIPLQVENLITQGTLKLLNGKSAPLAEELQAKIGAALDSGEAPGSFVFTFGPNSDPSYLVAYGFSFCAVCSRSWIGGFATRGGHYELVASSENPAPNQSVALVPLWTSTSQIEVVMYGTNWGDAHSRMNVTAYVFDGQKIQPCWSRLGLPQGTLSVEPDALTLRFLTSLRPPWKRRTELYAVTREGIELKHASETPED